MKKLIVLIIAFIFIAAPVLAAEQVALYAADELRVQVTDKLVKKSAENVLLKEELAIADDKANDMLAVGFVAGSLVAMGTVPVAVSAVGSTVVALMPHAAIVYGIILIFK